MFNSWWITISLFNMSEKGTFIGLQMTEFYVTKFTDRWMPTMNMEVNLDYVYVNYWEFEYGSILECVYNIRKVTNCNLHWAPERMHLHLAACLSARFWSAVFLSPRPSQKSNIFNWISRFTTDAQHTKSRCLPRFEEVARVIHSSTTPISFVHKGCECERSLISYFPIPRSVLCWCKTTVTREIFHLCVRHQLPQYDVFRPACTEGSPRLLLVCFLTEGAFTVAVTVWLQAACASRNHVMKNAYWESSYAADPYYCSHSGQAARWSRQLLF